MRQIICDKCKKVLESEHHYDTAIICGGQLKCSIDLCVECCNEYGIVPSTFRMIPVGVGIKLLDDLKEFICQASG